MKTSAKSDKKLVPLDLARIKKFLNNPALHLCYNTQAIYVAADQSDAHSICDKHSCKVRTNSFKHCIKGNPSLGLSIRQDGDMDICANNFRGSASLRFRHHIGGTRSPNLYAGLIFMMRSLHLLSDEERLPQAMPGTDNMLLCPIGEDLAQHCKGKKLLRTYDDHDGTWRGKLHLSFNDSNTEAISIHTDLLSPMSQLSVTSSPRFLEMAQKSEGCVFRPFVYMPQPIDIGDDILRNALYILFIATELDQARYPDDAERESEY